MIDLGLPKAKKNALIATLAKDHLIDVSVRILTTEHKHLGSITEILGGQVNIDMAADVTRQLQLSFVDREGVIRVDTSDGRPELRRMIQVHYKVRVGDEWVSIPIFTGPITSVKREADNMVNLEALGKEHLLMGPIWKSLSYPKSSNRMAVVRAVLTEAGERSMALPKGWKQRTKYAFSVKKQDSAWPRIKVVTKGSRAQIFYDGRGVARVRKHPVRSCFTFRDGDGGMILTPPLVAESSQDIVNTVYVVGAVPVGKKSPLVAEVTLPASHPYSPEELGRYGKKRHIVEEIDDDTLRTQADVDRAARRRLQEVQIDEQVVTFDCLPMPLLEEGDLVTIDSKDVKGTVRVASMVIPLTHDGVASIGYIAPASKRKRRV